jgi:hypothetical protein
LDFFHFFRERSKIFVVEVLAVVTGVVAALSLFIFLLLALAEINKDKSLFTDVC